MKVISTEVNFQGAVGNLQGVLDVPAENNTNHHFISVNCHPHSLHGGSMTNKVIYTVSRSIAGLGIPSLRFNFRGVGKSDGEYAEGIGEQTDLIAAVKWMMNEYPDKKLILTGFSFGSFVSAFAAKTLSPVILLSVAPPVKRFDFTQFQRPNCHWFIIMGSDDELVDFSVVADWVSSFNHSPGLVVMKGASHFFHGRLVELREHIEERIKAWL